MNAYSTELGIWLSFVKTSEFPRGGGGGGGFAPRPRRAPPPPGMPLPTNDLPYLDSSV
jgi:hypothetical protein